MTAIIGAAVLLYGATRLVVRLQASFNIMWDARIRPTQFSPITKVWLGRLLLAHPAAHSERFLLISIAVQSVMPLQSRIGHGMIIGTSSEWVAAFLITWGVPIFVFAFLPDIRISVRDCWQGALLTAVLCTIGTRAFSAFLALVGSVRSMWAWWGRCCSLSNLGRFHGGHRPAGCPPEQGPPINSAGRTWQPYEYAVIVEDPVGLGADEYDPEDWLKLYSGASEVAQKGLARTARKSDSHVTSEPSPDDPDDRPDTRSETIP